MAKSKIDWADWVWNPVTGCTKTSPGCANCYAEAMAKRLRAMGKNGYQNGFEVTMHPERLQEPMHWRKPRRVFVCSMGDLFHEKVPWEFQYKVFEVMLLTPQHTYIVLTKRADVMKDAVAKIWFHLGRNYPNAVLPLENVIGMVTAENQEMADRRIPFLLNTEFAVRGVSVEPMVSEINLEGYFDPTGFISCGGIPECECIGCNTVNHWPRNEFGLITLDWVICGGESGTGARPMHPAWVRSLRDQCQGAMVPFFFKQHGEWGALENHPETTTVTPVCFWDTSIVGTIPGWQNGLSSGGQVHMVRVGKKSAGRILDGRTWEEYPI